MNSEEIIAEAVKRAQKHAVKHKLTIGQGVAHPSGGPVYELRKIQKGVATVGLTKAQSRNGKAVTKKFPLKDLFDPNVASQKVSEIQNGPIVKGLKKIMGPNSGVLVVRL